jgi:hypothetical protein
MNSLIPLFVFGQPAVSLIGEGLAVLGTEVGRAAADVAATAELVEHVAHSQPLADVRIGTLRQFRALGTQLAKSLLV